MWILASWKELLVSPSKMIKIKLSVQVYNQMFIPLKTKHVQLKFKRKKNPKTRNGHFTLGTKISPCFVISPETDVVPFSLLLQKAVSVVTRILPSKWWVNTQTERAAHPVWYRQQKLLLKKCSQWKQRERGSESEILGGRSPPHLHLPSALALWHRQRLPYQLLSLLFYCFPQTPAKYGPDCINS